MRRRHDLVPLALLALSALACSKNQPEVAPIPVDSGARTTPPPPAPAPAPGSNTADPAAAAAAVTERLTNEIQRNLIHFDYNEDLIKPEDRPVLDAKAAILRANPAVRLRISGHADDRGSDEYNLVLGNKRALAAKRYLESKGIDGGRIEVTSLGEERPINPAGNESAWAENRRAEFEIIAGGARLVVPR